MRRVATRYTIIEGNEGVPLSLVFTGDQEKRSASNVTVSKGQILAEPHRLECAQVTSQS